MSGKMKKTKRSDFILVFDRYFSQKPSAVFSAVKRILYGCAECICMMFCLLEIYHIHANPWIIAACCAGFTAVFGVVFCFVKKRFAVPTLALVSCIMIYSNREAVWEKFKYFIDAVFRALNGTVFGMNRYLWHKESAGNVESEIIFTLIGVSCVLAAVCAGAMFKKPSGAAPLAVFIVLFAPMGIAQNLSFNLWAVPTAALVLGGFAAAKAFSSGVITRGGVYEGCRRAFSREERAFGANAERSSVIKRAELNAVHYSKYFSAAVCAAAVFTASGFLGAVIMNGSKGIDYSAVYDFFANIGKQTKAPSSDDEDVGFPDTGFLTDEFNQSLGIIAPGRSEREVLRIKNSGEEVYLRGDIGVSFNGLSWSSHTSRPWSGTADTVPSLYRPAEMLVLGNLEEALRGKFPDIYGSNVPEKYLSDGKLALAKKGEISVEYLTGTSVVFVPAYISEYSRYYGEGYYLYGDYVVRSKNERVNSLRYTALVPSINYSGNDAESKEQLVGIAEIISRVYNFTNEFDMTVVPGLSAAGTYRNYREYVMKTYLDVPGKMRDDLRAFLDENGLCRNNVDGNYILKYRACVEVVDFLKNNYAYSLDADNGIINPVMTFLTETKSGHCALYASAMTLMMRTVGIPARYCTGFIAPHTSDGEEAVIRSKNFHAWCEVYFDEIGWVTFDPTGAAVSGDIEIGVAPSGDGSSNDTQSPENSGDSIGDSQNSEDTDRETPDNSNDGGDDYDDDGGDGEDDPDEDNNSGGIINPEDEDETVNIFPFVIAGIAAVLIAALAAVPVYRFVRLDKEAKTALEKAQTFGSCEELYAKIIAALDLCGYRQDTGEQPERFFERADRHFKTELSKHSGLLMKIAFGNEEFDSGELSQTAMLLKTLFAAADSQLVAIGRVKLRRIIIRRTLK